MMGTALLALVVAAILWALWHLWQHVDQVMRQVDTLTQRVDAWDKDLRG